MSKIAISVENISKMYRLGEVGTGTLSHDLNKWWHKIRGKEDPYLKLGEKNVRDSKGGNYVWAVKDVSFEVEEGQVLGIIGKNGAGKSTLLKMLSRVTAPTTGIVKAKGRIASLLEVGTGFHPELTGRENIFLNGAILGMTKPEIRAKFDEIVDFSGVERYIDTPVKRYSSGMYVRLAFAVAAFLEPEILIVDEVLAVGDAEFQKRCLGRMKDVSTKEGRTVLFVSHNMSAVQGLCDQGLVLRDGGVNYMGDVNECVVKYLDLYHGNLRYQEFTPSNAPTSDFAKLLKAEVRPVDGTVDDIIEVGDAIELEFVFDILDDSKMVLDFTFHLRDEMGQLVFVGSTALEQTSLPNKKGEVTVKAVIPKGLMHTGSYTIDRVLLVKNRGTVLFDYREALRFEIIEQSTQMYGWVGAKEGAVRPTLSWSVR